MHQNDGGRALPGLARGAYSAPPKPLAELGGRGLGGVRTGEGEGRGRGKKERGGPPMFEVR